jgi:hypothetical protein
MLNPSKTTYQKSLRFDRKPALFRTNVNSGLSAIRQARIEARRTARLNSLPLESARGL